MEEFYKLFLEFDAIYIYIILFSFAFIENIVPPLPSDTFIVLGGTLINSNGLLFFSSLVCTSLGSVLGFMLMFYFGFTIAEKINENKFFKFLTPESISKVNKLFEKWGYGVIVLNRFLPGTRAVVSFCAGLAKMKFKIVTAICFVSSLAWNSLLLYVGSNIGNNIETINSFFKTYYQMAWIILGSLVLIILIRFIYQKFVK
ncbi:MAG: DedA family protein [Bacteroidetes bacterium]|nr:DedA family protein [Bacteroidota bacterium]